MRKIRFLNSCLLQICGVCALIETLTGKIEHAVVAIARAVRNIGSSEDVKQAAGIIWELAGRVTVEEWVTIVVVFLVACTLKWVLYERPRAAEKREFENDAQKKLASAGKPSGKGRSK